ncbi:MAG: peptide-methionine (S)-S-oxide reductase MsrA [Gammaproteobacteria bacterium]|nr:peptide-methionine (S)-S-oxide reductase MsrA [Gammaproteobacteria bacterium]
MNAANTHFVNQTNIKPPFPARMKTIVFGMGCFWGAEKCFWNIEGVYTTAVGYIGGTTSDPTYQEVCSGLTGHNEAVLVVYDQSKISINDLLAIFWQSHDPTQGMRQGNDRGTQYRSGVYTLDSEQYDCAQDSRRQYQETLTAANYGEITTEITAAEKFYYAEDYHQQYLAKNPGGYCGLGGTGVTYPH